MIFNFFKITFRNFQKNRNYVLINLTGLGLAIACCIVGYLNYQYEAQFDKNHVNHDKIFKIHAYKQVENDQVQIGITPLPLGDQIKNRYPGISHISRYAQTGLVLKQDLKVFNQNFGFVENDFLEMFSFPLKYGSPESLKDPSKVMLSEEVSESYFGGQDPTGEIMLVINSEGDQFPMEVGGVFASAPKNASIQFDALLHLDNYFKFLDEEPNDWSTFIAGTFVMTEDGEYPEVLLKDINANYIEIQQAARKDFKFAEYYLVKLSDLGTHSRDIPYNWLSAPPPAPAVTVPFYSAFLLLLIACFNFTNTSIAISSKRLKEIGIRKVMGSSRTQLIVQFMGENLILAFLSMIVGIMISFWLVPAYNALWDFINLELNFTSGIEIYVFLAILLVVTSLIAGGYPSLYISRYQPVKILRGSLSIGGTSLFSRILLGGQYMFTIIGLIFSLAFANNAEYQSMVDIGFSKENILGVRVNSMSEYEKYFNGVKSMAEIEKVGGSNTHIGWWHMIRNAKSESKEIEMSLLNLGIDYDEIMDLTILEGRYFDPDLYDYDLNNSIVVNEECVKEMGWEEPLGKVIQLSDTTRLNVIGVMKNFYQFGFFQPVPASGFRLSERDDMNFVVAKSQLPPTEFYKKMEELWYEVSPNKPFNAQFQSQAIDQIMTVNTNVVKMFLFLGTIALILSSIGLYTLVSLNIIKRIKEIGVRKVLGASVQQILLLMNRQFFWILFSASLIGVGLSYVAVDALMAQVFSVYKQTSPDTLLIPFIFLITLGVVIASVRILKSATRNPSESLKYE